MRLRLALAALCLFCLSVYSAPSQPAPPRAATFQLIAFRPQVHGALATIGPDDQAKAAGDLWAATVWYLAVEENNRPKPVPVKHHHAASSSSSSSTGGGTAECIGRVENHGDYGRGSNPTHFGKYQYDRQTWVAHGGNPDDWGTASPDEQERVFAQGTAQYGYSAWTPYDHC